VDELQRVDDWLAALLANLEPAARNRMMRQLAQQLRRTQQQNIRLQRNPDGSGYEPRRVTARSKKAHQTPDVCKASHHKIPENRRQCGLRQRAV
jgi:phage virion morphogenesis protein